MFERVTGFFRRFGGKKKKTAETAFLDEDDAGFDDFGLDDADFGDSVGTEELEGAPGGFDSGDDFGAMETFEATGAEATSLSGGSGENLLEDSLSGAETFETLGEFEGAGSGEEDIHFDTPQPANKEYSSGGSDEGDFLDDFGDLGEDFDSAGSSEVGAGDFEDLPQTPAAKAPAISIPKTVGVAVVGLVLGLLVTGVVLPMLSGKGAELDQKLGQADVALKKSQSELRQYDKLGGIPALEREKAELEGLVGAQGTVEEAKAAADEAHEQRTAYEAVIAAKTEAESLRADAEVQRDALQVKIDAAEIHLAQQQQAIGEALVEYQQRQRNMEDSVVVAEAFDKVDQQYTQDRANALLGGSAKGGE